MLNSSIYVLLSNKTSVSIFSSNQPIRLSLYPELLPFNPWNMYEAMVSIFMGSEFSHPGIGSYLMNARRP